MSDLTADLVADVVAASQEGGEEAAGALSRCLDREIALTVGDAGEYHSDSAPEGFAGAGLVALLQFGDVGFAAVLPESSGLLPEWYADPDPTGKSKLDTLAQELSMLVVPETLQADGFHANRVEGLSDALAAARVADNAAWVPLELSTGETTAQLSLIWPLAAPRALLPTSAATSPTQAETSDSTANPARRQSERLELSQLPEYSRSLLKICLPVSVILASKKESLQDVTELAPGTVVKFEKACDEMLRLYVGTQAVAEGEAVKVGDKFGFRVSAMLLPEEHFLKVQPTHAG